jgi:hypothetical protein
MTGNRCDEQFYNPNTAYNARMPRRVARVVIFAAVCLLAEKLRVMAPRF